MVKCIDWILINPPPGCGILTANQFSTGGSLMRFFNSQYQFYAGIDLHARKMFICIIDNNGNHGGKTKNDKIDSFKIATMMRGGMFSMVYVYLRKVRATRDLLRRRHYFTHHQAALLAHIVITELFSLNNFLANANPMPELPPVINTLLFVVFMSNPPS